MMSSWRSLCWAYRSRCNVWSSRKLQSVIPDRPHRLTAILQERVLENLGIFLPLEIESAWLEEATWEVAERRGCERNDSMSMYEYVRMMARWS